MYDLYLVTGATGTLGTIVTEKLLKRGARVRALAHAGGKSGAKFKAGVELCRGGVEDKSSLGEFFSGDLRGACLIHCAGLITIASRADARVWNINVNGTKNILELCLEKKVPRAVYVSSVDAVPGCRKGETVDEICAFDADRVSGQYAKSKAAASALALDAAREGLDISVALPSAILCPYSKGFNSISSTVLSYCRGKLPAAVRGGFDFADVRDVAEGVIACADSGKAGECYILSGEYATLRDILGYIGEKTDGKRVLYLPLWLVKGVSPFFELASLMRKKPLFLTPHSVSVLGGNARFSHSKASSELGYTPRPLHETLDDIVTCFTDRGMI